MFGLERSPEAKDGADFMLNGSQKSTAKLVDDLRPGYYAIFQPRKYWCGGWLSNLIRFKLITSAEFYTSGHAEGGIDEQITGLKSGRRSNP